MSRVAPDALHKANISGGAPYGIELPFAGVDAVFGNSEYSLPLVEYLRECVRWGGFPRLARYDGREDVLAFVERMTDGIEPF
ncbi:MAG: hypothetical protein AB8H86_32410 [Polyangiales bacterium]